MKTKCYLLPVDEVTMTFFPLSRNCFIISPVVNDFPDPA